MSDPAKIVRVKSLAPLQAFELPELQLIYDIAPVGLAFLSTDCRYVQVNQRLTEICGISVADHIGRSVRETVPQVAEQVEAIVQTVLRTGEPLIGIEVNGQRPDKLNAERFWLTSWHPLKTPEGTITGISVVGEEITERKRAEAVLAASENALRESEARFRELADNMSQFAWTADATGWRYWFNRRWYEYTGTTLEEVQGWGWQKVHHPDHVGRVVRKMRECFNTGRPWEDTFPLRGRDGDYRWFLSRASPIRNQNGDIVRWFGTNTDVTEQIEAESALRQLNVTLEQRVEAETQERLRIWNVSEDLLMEADQEGVYLRINPAWTATLGWSEADLLGKTSQWLLHPEDHERTRVEIRSLASGQRTRRFENRFRHRDGSYRWLSWRATPDQGRIYAVARDVTDLKLAEGALRESRRELARVTRQTTLAAMTASIAHEISQPLSAIVANANAGARWLSRPHPDIGEALTALKRIVDEGHRAADIVTSIRAMFRKDDHERREIDVNGLIRETIALVHGEIESQQAVLKMDLLETSPTIVGENVPLQQVLINLIMNALDAMSTVKDREHVLSVKSYTNERGGVLISVADSGTGIAPENAARVFEPFFTTKSHGLGMGLSICRSIVEAHNGRLLASSALPHGCIFHIHLPSGPSQ